MVVNTPGMLQGSCDRTCHAINQSTGDWFSITLADLRGPAATGTGSCGAGRPWACTACAAHAWHATVWRPIILSSTYRWLRRLHRTDHWWFRIRVTAHRVCSTAHRLPGAGSLPSCRVCASVHRGSPFTGSAAKLRTSVHRGRLHATSNR
jgi:hypothetical protein